ncbi:MAG: TSUP family transporter [Alphaproteobacteria bacterium]|nr:TSUP family transporter [Alphaproteobacteria bacterium]
MTYVIASGIALAAGIASGFFGIGGGIIIIPSLVFALGITQTQAAATSLAAMLLPVGLLGVLTYWKAGELPAQQISIAAILAAGLLFGAPLGAKLALLFDDDFLRKAFALLLVFAAVKLAFK